MAPDHVLEDPARRLVAVERARDRLDRAGADLVPLADEVGQLAHDRAAHRDVVVLPVEGQHVAAQEDLAVEVLLEGLHHQVTRARELRGHIVGQLELDSHYEVSFSLTAALTRLRAVGAALDLRHHQRHHLAHLLREEAPDSATASPTIAPSSSSEICSGR